MCKDVNKKHKIKWRVLTLEDSKKFEKGFDLFKKYFFDLWDQEDI